LRNLGHDLKSGAVDSADFFQMFNVHAYHAWAQDHWREGYAWFACLTAAVALFLPLLSPRVRRRLLTIFATSFLLIAIYASNVYVIQWPPLALTYLFRVTYFLKPLSLGVITVGLLATLDVFRVAWRQWEPSALALNGSILLVTVFSVSAACFAGSIATAEASFLSALGLLHYIWSSSVSRRRLGLFVTGAGGVELIQARGTLRWLLPNIDLTLPVSLFGIGVAFVLTMTALLDPSFESSLPRRRRTPVGARGSLRTAAGAVAAIGVSVLFSVYRSGDVERILPTALSDLKRRVEFSTPDSSCQRLFRWVRTASPKGALFAVPPLDGRFMKFRLSAERGVFVIEHDINQLAFAPRAYIQAGERLRDVGVVVQGRHRLDARRYERLEDSDFLRLNAQGVDFAVVPSNSPARRRWHGRVAYEDMHFSVLTLD
jgi:hypothetical protein